ncbi:hypothetical protein MRB53_040138 [Persea americana]|nr:hypothetical protein MRB53_040138 [Persea americana]
MALDHHHAPVEQMSIDTKPISKSALSRQSKSLYVSHFISTWNSRGFEFGAVLFLASIYPGTLLPMSVYALLRAAAAIVFSPVLGEYIDRHDRLSVIRVSIVGQRLAVAVSCGVFLTLLLFQSTTHPATSIALFLLSTILACVEKLCIIMNTIAVERDWVVVIAGTNDGLLQEMNSQMRRIDLFCKLMSPLVIALIDGYSTSIAITLTIVLNSTSVIAEYFLISWVYMRTPALALPKHNIGEQETELVDKSQIKIIYSTIVEQTKIYVKSHAFLPSLSLSMLYLTVLSFSGQMTTYLLALSEPHISKCFYWPHTLLRNIGRDQRDFRCTTSRCTTRRGASRSPNLSTAVFIAAIVLSRVGLWAFDLTAQLLVQNSVDSEHRGSFSATEAGLQNFFELCTFAMTMVWSRPEQFRYPATFSLVATCIAAAIYARLLSFRMLLDRRREDRGDHHSPVFAGESICYHYATRAVKLLAANVFISDELLNHIVTDKVKAGMKFQERYITRKMDIRKIERYNRPFEASTAVISA